MVPLASLWLPIILAAVAVFIVSSVIHMGPFWHRSDYPRLANEDALMTAVGPLAIPPGDYMVPRAASMEDMKTPEFSEKVKRGPNMILTVLPNGPFSMASNLSQWFIYLLVVTLFAAYIASRALGAGAEAGGIFRFTATTAFLGHAAALWQMSIWYRRAWSMTLKSTFDALIYAAVTGAVFVWMWPR